MSMQNMQEIPCRNCSASNTIEIYHTVNIGRLPTLKEQILNDKLQSINCKNCGARVRVEPLFPYIDLKNKLWIATRPASEIILWREIEEDSANIFNLSLGPDAPGSTHEMNTDIKPRVVFGWSALKEKLLAHDAGISDVELEMAKVATLKSGAVTIPNTLSNMRLVGFSNEFLILCWFDQTTQKKISNEFHIDYSSINDMRKNPERWANLKEMIDVGLYIDLGRAVNL